MTLLDYAKRVFRYGLRGVRIWADIKKNEFKLRSFFRKNARRFAIKPSYGVTLVGSYTAHDSINKVMRDLLLSISEAGIPCQALNIGPDNDPAQTGVLSLVTPKERFEVRKHPLVLEILNSIVPAELVEDPATIVFWEFEDGFLPVYPAYAKKTHVIGMSDFVVETMRRELPASVKVSKLLYPFRPVTAEIPPRSDIRKRFGIAPNAFAVFFNFDFASGFARKNPDGVMRAFSMAFKSHSDAFLVFKTMRAARFPELVRCLEKLANGLGIEDRFLMIHDYLSNDDLYGLTGACDVYLSLHRGEGFGLGVAEAMSMGLPVVVSDYSATTEFCKQGNSIPVPCKVVPVESGQNDHLTYSYVTRWADPDVEFAAEALKRLKSDAKLREQIGAEAKADVLEHFSLANFRASMESLLVDSVS